MTTPRKCLPWAQAGVPCSLPTTLSQPAVTEKARQLCHEFISSWLVYPLLIKSPSNSCSTVFGPIEHSQYFSFISFLTTCEVWTNHKQSRPYLNYSWHVWQCWTESSRQPLAKKALGFSDSCLSIRRHIVQPMQLHHPEKAHSLHEEQ